jgi:peptidase C25-like protein
VKLHGLGRAALVSALVAACLALTAAARPNDESPALGRQWAIAGGQAVKIDVKNDGWYHVSRSLLQRAGANVAAPSRLRLYADGQEVPILVDRAGIRFYGQGLDTPSTNARTYWLVSGAAGGRRIPVVSARASRRSSFPRSFQFVQEHKYRTLYSLVSNGDRENYFGSVVYSKPSTFSLRPHGLASSQHGVLEVVLQGLSKKDHHVAVGLNGKPLGNIAFGALESVSRRFVLPSGLLRTGKNSLTLTSTGGETDASFIDTTRLTYPRLYRAEHNALQFSLSARVGGRITAFSRSDVTVVDVTRPTAPRLVRPTVVRAKGGFTAFLAPAAHARRLIAFTTPAAPAAVSRNRPSRLHDPHGADVVIIGYRSFLPQLARLKAYHEQQGLKVALIDVQDLYDEFSFGAHDPDAIKAFLARARTRWQPAPRYVILGGDATSDPRNYLHARARDFVPTKTVDTQYMEAPSDDWFVDFDNDGVPEMALGRLPVQTPAEAASVVNKIINYEQGPTLAARNALLVSDTGFEAPSESLAKLLPTGTSAVTVNRRDGPTDAAVRGRILDVLNQGPSVVNYYGHGAVNIWTGAPLLDSGDAPKLRNAGRLSLYVMMTCLNGYFTDPKRPGLAEALLRAPVGGAFAVWASSALTEPGDQIRANEELFRQLSGPESPRLGDAMVRAKSVIHDRDVRRSWILFGDPVTHLR